MTGPLVLSSAPTSAMQATTKNYVDNAVVTSLPLSGGVLEWPAYFSR